MRYRIKEVIRQEKGSSFGVDVEVPTTVIAGADKVIQ
jgi:hypothetical protein